MPMSHLGSTTDRGAAAATAGPRLGGRAAQVVVRPSYLLTGYNAIPMAFYAGCSSVQIQGNNAGTTQADIARAAGQLPAAVLTASDGRPPAYARTWLPHRGGSVGTSTVPVSHRDKSA
jgi:hypothetical protein